MKNKLTRKINVKKIHCYIWKVISVILLILLLVLFKINNSLSKQIKPAFTEIKYTSSVYNNSATRFYYSYPTGWHIQYDCISYNQKYTDNSYACKDWIFMSNAPIFSPFESDYGSIIKGGSFLKEEQPQTEREYVDYLNTNCPFIVGERGENFEKYVPTYACLPNYSPMKLNYKLFNDKGYCYDYKYFEGISGSNKHEISCTLYFKSGMGFKFTLNNTKYANEFKYFIESIKETQ